MKRSVLQTGIGLSIGIICGIGITYCHMKKRNEKQRTGLQDYVEKNFRLFLLMNQWIRKIQQGKDLEKFLKEKGFQRVAVYGMSYIGETVCEKLCQAGIEVSYGIDRRKNLNIPGVPIVSPEGDWPETEAILVTAICDFDQIEELIEKKTTCQVLNLEDIIFEM